MQRRLLARSGPTSQRHALLLLVVVLLTGVLGMHALSLHGQPVPGPSDQTLLTVAVLDGQGHGHGLAGHSPGERTDPTGPPGGDGHDHGLAELCLAILLGLTILTLPAVALRSVTPGVRLRDLLPRRLDLPALLPRARGPSLATLCLLRC